jgi:predicted amino acid-binding ACT domain protein
MHSTAPTLSPYFSAGNRQPALVPLPRPGAPRGARLVRLRVRDRPGSLAAVAGHFAQHGVNVLRLEVLTREAGFAIDDFLLSGPNLTAALETLGSDAIVLANRHDVDLHDPGLAMASACGAVTAAGTAREACKQLVRAGLELVFAEGGVVCIREGHSFLRPIASTVADLPVLEDGPMSLLRSALFSGQCLTADGRTPWAATTFREKLPSGSVLAVPGGSAPFLVLVLVREDDARFVSAEVDRLAALMRVAVGTLQLHDQHFAVSRGRPAIASLRR